MTDEKALLLRVFVAEIGSAVGNYLIAVLAVLGEYFSARHLVSGSCLVAA